MRDPLLGEASINKGPHFGQPGLSVLFALFPGGWDSPPASKRTKIPRKIQGCPMRSSSAGAEMLADKEKAAENTLCILKGFDAVCGHRLAERRAPLPIDASVDGYAIAAGSFPDAVKRSSRSSAVCICEGSGCAFFWPCRRATAPARFLSCGLHQHTRRRALRQVNADRGSFTGADQQLLAAGLIRSG